MFEISMFNVDQFVHAFVQNFGIKVESPIYKHMEKITFIPHVDKPRRLKRELLCIAEKIKDIAMQQNLDFFDERNVQCFIEKHTNFFDKFMYSRHTQFMSPHLKNINKKIIQEFRARNDIVENTRKAECKMSNKNDIWSRKRRRRSLVNSCNKYEGSKKNVTCSVLHKENHCKINTSEKKNLRGNIRFQNSKICCPDTPANHGTVTDNVVRCDLANDAALKQTAIAEKFVRLYVKDVEFLKRNVHVILHISKELKRNSTTRSSNTSEILSLCQHAMLCLIEPSKKAFVLVEDDLSVALQKYLSKGCEYHFNAQRGSKDYYLALLILSSWAKVLVTHLDTTVMIALCSILGCNVQRILVLSYPDEKSEMMELEI